MWTYTAPISAISITVIPPRLRATSCGVLIFCQHILGDIISPPIIGAISDATGSLKNGLQITWIALLLSGVAYFIGYACLEPLDIYAAIAMNDGVDVRKRGIVQHDTTPNLLLHPDAAEGGEKGGIPEADEDGGLQSPWVYGGTSSKDGGSEPIVVPAVVLLQPSYSSLLCTNNDPLVLKNGRVVLRADQDN